jgi:hypothetical protein
MGRAAGDLTLPPLLCIFPIPRPPHPPFTGGAPRTGGNPERGGRMLPSQTNSLSVLFYHEGTECSLWAIASHTVSKRGTVVYRIPVVRTDHAYLRTARVEPWYGYGMLAGTVSTRAGVVGTGLMGCPTTRGPKGLAVAQRGHVAVAACELVVYRGELLAWAASFEQVVTWHVRG